MAVVAEECCSKAAKHDIRADTGSCPHPLVKSELDKERKVMPTDEENGGVDVHPGQCSHNRTAAK